MFKFLILCLFVSLSVSTLIEKISKFHGRKRIFGGEFITQESHIPYQAAIKIFRSENHHTAICSGSLITTKFVLTAAHCLYNIYLAQIGFGVASLCKIKKSRMFMSSKKFIRHENYTRGVVGLYDIGLIELPNLVKLDTYIETVKLPAKAEAHETYIGYTAKISGWGYSERFKLSSTLKMLKTVISTPQECIFPYDVDFLLCAYGDDGGRTCNGDSGGPLVIQNSDNTNTQIGLVSYGQFQCDENFPTVYTRVSKFLDWIEQNSNYKST